MIVTIIDSKRLNSTKELVELIGGIHSGIVCLTHFPEKCHPEDVQRRLKNIDLLHCGLSFHQGRPFEQVQICAFNWHFLTPQVGHSMVSWKPSPEFVAFDVTMLNDLGGLDLEYESLDAALIDLAYRVLIGGGIPWCDHELAEQLFNSRTVPRPVSLNDEMRFVGKFLGIAPSRFFQLYLLMRFSKWIPVRHVSYLIKRLPRYGSLIAGEGIDSVEYSAIIPTINRYDYITSSIDSLLQLGRPPKEIIVIDQTPVEYRNTQIYQRYDSEKVRIVYLDKAGQSTARNIGIELASCSWLLLFEDDATAWKDMVDQHLFLLNASGCEASSGVVVGPGETEQAIPEANRFYFISDIFTTGNAFLSKQLAQKIHGFDPAFDRGPGADDDFGRRLYFSGAKILYNYKSIETHYKAPRGGMREHGAWWRNTTTLFGAFPPPTQMYAIEKYYRREYRLYLILAMLLKARRKYSMLYFLSIWLLLPLKIFKAKREAAKLR